MYNIIRETPEEGRFIRIWQHNGKLWSDTIEITEEGIKVYEANEDKWVPISTYDFNLGSNCKQIRYITVGED